MNRFISKILVILIMCMFVGLVFFVIADMNNKKGSTFEEISITEYSAKINNEEEFVLYIYSDSCKYCDKFRKEFEAVLEITQVRCVMIEYSKNKENLKEILGEKCQGAPAVYFYKDGNLSDYFIGTQEQSTVLQYLYEYVGIGAKST